MPRNGEERIREAELLKRLRHPGIPIIYDLEADSNYFYLIEEYLDGESLHALIQREGCLTKAKLIQWGIELCRIIYYLHSFEPIPILYLDLQPANILISHGMLKLIDFDQSVLASAVGNLQVRCGTKGFAAPEQYNGEPLDERTDIYAIGALLYYMETGQTVPDCSGTAFLPEGDGLSVIVERCTARRKEARYQSVQGVLKDLNELRARAFTKNGMSLLRIAVVGSRHGIGVTHTAFSLTSFLSGCGITCLYREKNETGAVRKMAVRRNRVPDPYGVFHMADMAMKPSYGCSVRLDEPSFDAVVDDLGTEMKGADQEEYELILLMCGTKDWEIGDSVAYARYLAGKNVRILLACTSRAEEAVFPADINRLRFFRTPYMPFPPDGSQKTFFAEVLRGTEIETYLCGGNKRKRKRGKAWNFFRGRF